MKKCGRRSGRKGAAWVMCEQKQKNQIAHWSGNEPRNCHGEESTHYTATVIKETQSTWLSL